MNLILIAPPAAGKGTIAKLLNEKYGLIGIGAGELLRGVNPGTKLGKKIRKLQSKRILVPDDITNELIKNRLSEGDIKKYGAILDGYPRRMEQVYAFNDICRDLSIKIDYVIYLKVDYDIALQRTIGRKICPECKTTYNVLTKFNRPQNGEICDECKVPLVKRNDDNEESLKAGLNFFEKNTLPVVEYYKSKGGVIEIDGNQDAYESLKEIEALIGLKK